MTNEGTKTQLVVDLMLEMIPIEDGVFEFGAPVALVVEYDGKFHGVSRNWQSVVIGGWAGDGDNNRISINGEFIEGCRIIGYYPTEWRDLS